MYLHVGQQCVCKLCRRLLAALHLTSSLWKAIPRSLKLQTIHMVRLHSMYWRVIGKKCLHLRLQFIRVSLFASALSLRCGVGNSFAASRTKHLTGTQYTALEDSTCHLCAGNSEAYSCLLSSIGHQSYNYARPSIRSSFRGTSRHTDHSGQKNTLFAN